MRSLASAPSAPLASLEGLLFDLDDTVLTHGRLTVEAFQALWDLHEAGLRLVAVTGRPSGWAEVLVRQWPIDAAVAENGAVHVVPEGRGVRRILGEPAYPERLAALVREVAAEVPDVALADDHAARIADVAWDIGERATVSAATISALARAVTTRGARTTRSSIHLHATFTRDDKASGAVRLLGARFGTDAGAALSRWAFVGDSTNDAACFAAFRWTFGVANVRAYAGSMSVPPRWVARGERGAGFAEVARTLLDARAG